MHRGFLHNVSFLIIINLIIKPIYILLIDREVQNVIGPAEYGIFFALFNFSYLFHIINDFGIQAYNARFVAQQGENVKEQLKRFLSLKIYLAFIYLLIVLMAAWSLDYESHFYPLLFILAFNHICIGYVFYLRSNFTGLSKYRQDALMSVLDRGLLILSVGLCLLIPSWRTTFTIYTFVIAQTASLLIAIIVGLIMLSDELPQRIIKWMSWSEIITTLKKTWPFALTVFLMTLYTRLDGVMIERLLVDGETEAGIYASGYRLLDASNMVIFLIASLLLPMFASSWTNHHKLSSLFNTGFRLIMVLCFPLAIVFFFYAEEIIDFLYIHADAYWGDVFAILILTFISTGFIYLFSTYITASGKLKKMNGWFVMGIAANLILNFILIPIYQALGAAIATLLTQSLVAIALIFEARKSFVFLKDIHWGYLLFFLVVCFTVPYTFKYYTKIHWMFEVVLGLGIIWVSAFIFGVVKRDVLRSLISSRFP